MTAASLTLDEAGISLAPIGFGCAGLMRLPSAQARMNLIDSAIDAGLTHFDVARMYGLGAAEAELVRALRPRTDQLTVATKFGIDASGSLRRLGRLQGPARALLARSDKVRSAVRSRREAFATPRRYDPVRARASLDESLRQLALDHVDILFLHDPRPQDEIDGAALVEFLEQARAAGKIRAWGASLDAVSGLSVLSRLPARGMLQVRRDVLADALIEEPHLAFGVMSAHAAITRWLQQNDARRREWTDALGADPLSGALLCTLLLAEALAEPGIQAILYATTQPQRLAVAARLLSSPPPDRQVAAFRKLLAPARAALRPSQTTR